MGKNAKTYRQERDEAREEIARLSKLLANSKQLTPVVHLMHGNFSYCGTIGGFKGDRDSQNNLLRTEDPGLATCKSCIRSKGIEQNE